MISRKKGFPNLNKFSKTLNPSEPLHTEINPGKYYDVKVNREYAKPLNLVVEFSSWRESYLFTREKVCVCMFREQKVFDG